MNDALHEEIKALRKEIVALREKLEERQVIPFKLSVGQAARALGKHRSTVIRMIEDGRISPIPGKRPYQIPRDQIFSLIK